MPSAAPFTSRCLVYLNDFTIALRTEDRDENAIRQAAQHEQLKAIIRTIVSTEKVPDKAIYQRGFMIDFYPHRQTQPIHVYLYQPSCVRWSTYLPSDD